ncbi:MAG: SIMPL domain-containing protein [Lachnospiraceae bacterium]|nr:SIMPL domain-containing protein [Lachnospiraceae bacterium]
MNKKLMLPVLLITALTLLCTACGNSSTADAPPAAETSSAEPDEDKNVVLDIGDKISYYTGNSISVKSSEAVNVTPDIAQIVYSVRTEEKTASGCQQGNGEAVSSVIAQLKELGVSEASIQTSDYYMHPVYNYSGNTARVTGYEAVTSLTVSDLPIDGLDEILSKSVDGGINTIQSITYMASNYDAGYQEALRKAVDTAYQKAQVLAQASGRSVGTALNITEVSGYSEARYNDTARSNMMASGAAKEMAMEDYAAIMPGEIQVEASIIVEYQMY